MRVPADLSLSVDAFPHYLAMSSEDEIDDLVSWPCWLGVSLTRTHLIFLVL